jgi:hypothetical protein
MLLRINLIWWFALIARESERRLQLNSLTLFSVGKLGWARRADFHIVPRRALAAHSPLHY